MRPKKTRRIKCDPGERLFKPKRKTLNEVRLSLDEFEAVRLVDVEGLKQEEAARKMNISRPTLSRIISVAHQKIGDALVNIKAIRVEGGCCEIIDKGEK